MSDRSEVAARPTWVMPAYVGILFVAAVAIAIAALRVGVASPSAWVTAGLAVLAAVAERGRVRLSSNSEVSISLLPTVFAAVTLGPVAALIVGAAAMLGDPRPIMRCVVYTASGAITGGLSGLAAQSVGAVTDTELGAIALATIAAMVVAQVVDVMFATMTLAIRGTGDPLSNFAVFLPVVPPTILLGTAVVGPLALAYSRLSPWVVPFFVLPALAMHRLFAMYQEQRRLAIDLARSNSTLERANLSFASALVATLDARDRYTAGHSAAVAVYARDIARELGLTEEEQQRAHLAGLVHDIGKIGVAPGILEKQGPLTLGERSLMEQHSAIGERILANVEAYGEIARIVRHHHERIDGLGYPDGLAGSAIPVISRIICVADAYNAMTSDRPYRDAMPSFVARERLRQAAGTQFDGDVVEAFEVVLKSETAEYAVAGFADFGSEASEYENSGALSQADAA